MNIPTMTEHRKMQESAVAIDALLAFVRHLKDNGWTVNYVDGYGAVTERLDLTDQYVYQWLGIDTKALEAEREQAVRYVLDATTTVKAPLEATQGPVKAIAAQIVIELSRIKDSYMRQKFLEELKDQTNYCWNCGDEFPYTGVCCCQCDD